MNFEEITSPKNNHIPQLDGLRGVAILLVITFHYFGFIKVFSFGWTGVDLFFVLSGYLITGKLLDSLNKPNYFRSFYKNRMLRIFPLYYLVLIIFFLAVLILPKNQHISTLHYYPTHWAGFFFFFQNWIMIFFGLPKEPYLIHFWSLAVEEQFYIVWPFIIYFFGNNKKLFAILAGTVCSAIAIRCVIYFHFPSSWDYAPDYFYNSFCRMDAFIIGGMISFAYRQKKIFTEKKTGYLLLGSSLLVIAGILICRSVSFASPFFATIGYTAVAMMYAGLLSKSMQEHSLIHKALKNSFLRFCGKISYGLYIFHWPVLLILNLRMFHWASAHLIIGSNIANFLCVCICLLLTFVISWLSYHFFESYFLRLKNINR